ncbi:cation diffusion facilitator family transporter [Sphingopyxis alaskensis]|uniref:Cation efflux protein n=1 Tax=Sphingopyxis alaskensis (strain DSM 13593 / LMG 18877 / RB2256) TaxID=317655 RepID=Q1GPZ1_SPHAL|nr:cation diffusion facilitator family transporter [Sphingopyxis alaskensis]ABF54281.1 cation efflux protein [Sphingopyxis alaskensis RB2256]MCM3418008.1 cation diffusion facilitator family transporter [Sphingopyxis alaskensis]
MGELDVDPSAADKRRTLWIVLWLNVAIAAGFFATGYVADSNALFANGVDNSSDAIVYALSLLAFTRSRQWKRGAARFSGVALLIFAGGVIVDAVRRFLQGSEPGGITMMGMAAIAGGVNLLSLHLLSRLKDKDVNLRAATTFSFNDFVSNGGVLLAGIVVMLTGTNWPDLIVGVAVAGIALYGGIEILRDAHMDVHDEEGTVHGSKQA